MMNGIIMPLTGTGLLDTEVKKKLEASEGSFLDILLGMLMPTDRIFTDGESEANLVLSSNNESPLLNDENFDFSLLTEAIEVLVSLIQQENTSEFNLIEATDSGVQYDPQSLLKSLSDQSILELAYALKQLQALKQQATGAKLEEISPVIAKLDPEIKQILKLLSVDQRPLEEVEQIKLNHAVRGETPRSTPENTVPTNTRWVWLKESSSNSAGHYAIKEDQLLAEETTKDSIVFSESIDDSLTEQVAKRIVNLLEKMGNGVKSAPDDNNNPVNFLQQLEPIFKNPNINQQQLQSKVVEQKIDYSQLVKDQVMQNVKLMLNEGKSEISFQLYPKELGRISLSINVEKGIVLAKFAAASIQVKSLIESSLPQLRQSLEDLGMTEAKLEVSVGQQQLGEGRPQQQWQKTSLVRRIKEYDTSETPASRREALRQNSTFEYVV
ncbi:MAG: flagellar hook-length control protein FliK [Bacillota bacterium]|nr:flagellar hook-length control protein FliK [Bacillota bacterium]